MIKKLVDVSAFLKQLEKLGTDVVEESKRGYSLAQIYRALIDVPLIKVEIFKKEDATDE